MSKQKNETLAKEAIEHIRQFIEGTNISDQSVMKSIDVKMNKFKLHLTFEKLKTIDEKAQHVYQAIQKDKSGTCGEQAFATYHYLKEKDVVVDLCKMEGGDHNFVMIGREIGSSTGDPSTWGDNVIVCDTWANKFYPFSAFEVMQAPENDIERHSDFKIKEEQQKHYLHGNLKIVHSHIPDSLTKNNNKDFQLKLL
ncbi:MAG: hypothetical protein LCH30_04720 [Proteobacteria bacterium]|nr:hypothetical protein [Pseudomonadota bacterium]